MESIGQILKAARERRQISIADVVAATKMTSVFVKAIEANDFNALVAPIYARGFIKLYAECVGLDPMPLMKQFDLSSRAASVLSAPVSKAPPAEASIATAEKLKTKTGQAKFGGRSKTVSPAASVIAAPARVSAPASLASSLPAWLASLRAERLLALSRLFGARFQWARFDLPGIFGRRVFIVASVAVLVIIASLAWEWSHRGLPATTDACRWLADPPAPYLNIANR